MLLLLYFIPQIQSFKNPKNIMGKGEKACSQHFFSISHIVFYPLNDQSCLEKNEFVACECFNLDIGKPFLFVK